ncbi:MAG: class I SAM-dependent methyltransferase [Acidimicrobiales bacterium]
MPDRDVTPLTPEERAARAASFGGAAAQYARYRQGPPMAAVEWILPDRVATVVDLGAGTGGLTRLLVERADEVIAVEPDDRMRAVLAESLPRVRALAGRGESMPLPDASADAVVASSSWHWMDPVPTLHEVGRVLVPGGTLGALWSGPDPESPFMTQARDLLGGGGTAGLDERERVELDDALNDGSATVQALEIPPGVPFDQPEQTVITWEVALDADELVGLLGTFSWVILMEEGARARLFETARRLLRDALGVEGDVTVDVGYRAEVWSARRR